MRKRVCLGVFEFEFEWGDRFVDADDNPDVGDHADNDDFDVVDNAGIVANFDIVGNTSADENFDVDNHADDGNTSVIGNSAVDNSSIITNFDIVGNTSADENSVVGEDTDTGNVVCSEWGLKEVSSSARKGLAGWLICLYDTCLACFRLWSALRRRESGSGSASRGFSSHSGNFCSRSNRGSKQQ